MDISDIMQELQEIKQNPSVLSEIETEIEKLLKEVIKIERRYLYGLDSTSTSKRREAIRELLIQELKNKD